MQIKPILLAILIAASLISCKEEPMTFSNIQSGEAFTWKNFTKETSLSGLKMKLSNSKKPDGVLVIPAKNLLVVAESDGEYLCSAYSLDSLNYIKSFIKKGEGPEDQLVAFVLRYDTKKESLDVTDPPKRSIYSYSIDSIKAVQAAVRPFSVSKVKAERVDRAIILNDRNIVDVSSNKNPDSISRLTLYDSSGNLLGKLGQLPAIADGFRPYEQDEIFMCSLTDLPGDSAILITCFSTDIIEKYDKKGRLIKRMRGPDNIDPDSKRIKKGIIEYLAYGKKARGAYSTARADDNNILISYEGALRKESKGPGVLFLFDKNLVPKEIYKLNIPVDIFDVDWKTRTVYGISLKVPGEIITYNF